MKVNVHPWTLITGGDGADSKNRRYTGRSIIHNVYESLVKISSFLRQEVISISVYKTLNWPEIDFIYKAIFTTQHIIVGSQIKCN